MQCYRHGADEGARTWAESRADGIDWVVFVNTKEFDDRNFMNLLGGGLSAWLDTDPAR